MKWLEITITLGSIILLSACTSSLSGPEGPNGELPRELTSTEKILAEADQSFSYSIFRNTVEWDDSENVFISPLSISMALAMTLNGAEGETYEDMKSVLNLDDMEMDAMNEGFQSMRELLVNLDPDVQLKIANSIWYKDGLPVKDSFLERMESFEAQIEALDFEDPSSADEINSWVSENTDGLIPDIVDEISSDMMMYLINALYFQGEWLNRFDADETRKADFHLESGETTEVDMMRQSDQFAAYFSDEVRVIELPYGDSLYSMTVLLPADENMEIDTFVDEKITPENLAEWRSNLATAKVPVELPKFELEYEITYNDILKAMGMDIAFDRERADFSGIADVSPENLYISEVKHKTFITVDEEGTEAAAATSVGVSVTSLPPSMIVNRPFVFIIHERETGMNLFLGKVKNPVVNN